MPEKIKVEVAKEKGQVFLKIAKVSVYVLVFLLPLFFLPFTANVLEFQKQALLFLLVLVSFLSWIAYVLTSYKLEINKSFVNIPVALLLLFVLLSTLFSVFRYGSFWGLSLPLASSFLTLLTLTVLYLIIANLFGKEEIPFLFLTLFASGALAALFFVFQLFNRFIFPFDFAKNTSFNTLGTVNSLAIFFALLLILIVPLFFFVKRFFKVVLGIFGLLLLFSLALINFKSAWLVFLAGNAVLFALGTVSLKKAGKSGFITLLMAFLIIALFFSFFKFSIPGVPAVPLEIGPSQKASFEVLTKLPVKHLLIGSGPGAFFYNWAKYKPAELNQTIFWGVRFSQPSSEILAKLIDAGILGLLAFLFLLAVCLKQVFVLLLDKIKTESQQDVLDRFLLWGIFAGLVGSTAAFFLYPTNISILLLLWMLVAFAALLAKDERHVFDLQTSALRAMGASFLAVLVLILSIGLAVLYGQKYFAEVRYFQGLMAWQRGDVEQSAELISRAASLNPKTDFYWRDLSQIFLFQLNQLLASSDLPQDEVRRQAEAVVASAVNSASQATIASPNNVANWNIRGFVYQNMIGVLGGADNWAIASYQRSSELEPSNPYIFTEIGRTYLVKSDLLAQQKKDEERIESLSRARENFSKAIELKADYAPAHFLTAMIYVREGKIKEAIAQLEETREVAPLDTGLAFQLGLIYYNDNQLDKAKAEFERAILLNENYSNARYFLGLTLDKQGNKKEAITQFEKIEELNLDNQEIKKILANLRAGKEALEGVVPSQPPIEEKPEEQLEK